VIFKNKLSNPFVKTLVAGGFTQSFMILSGLAVNKIIAMIVGPSGTMLYGQFNNLFQLATKYSTFFSETGIIKITSENKSDKNERKLILSTSFKILLLTSFIGGILSIIFSNNLSIIFFQENQYRKEIIYFGISIIFFALNRFCICILNAFNEIRKISSIRIFQSTLTLLLSSSLAWIYGIKGVMISLITSQYFIFIYSLYLLKKTNWFRLHYFFGKLDINYLKKILKFSLMGFATTFSIIITMEIRSFLTLSIDAESAGLWDGMLKISNGYLAIITSSFSLYYLPKLSSLKDDQNIKKEILSGFKLLLPIMLLFVITLLILKSQIISVLYTDEYLLMADFFFPRLSGDFIRIMAQCFAYLMISKAMTKFFIFVEIYFSLQYLFLVWLCVPQLGIIGAFWAYTINNSLYLILMIFKFKKYLF
jgi:O-antigen/teichoic acid export membrane protein